MNEKKENPFMNEEIKENEKWKNIKDNMETRHLEKKPEKKIPYVGIKKMTHQYPKYFYSGLFIRTCSYLVDLLIVLSLQNIILRPVFSILNIPMSSSNITTLYGLSKTMVLLSYFVLMTYLANGQTIGKMIFGIRVVDFDSEKLRLSTVLIREIFGRLIIYHYPYICLILLFTSKKQHFIDLLCDTSVVTENIIDAYQLDSQYERPTIESI